MDKKFIPAGIKGKNINLESSTTLPEREEARSTFKRAFNRMLNPAVWHTLCGTASAEFTLTSDMTGEEHRLAKEGDYFRIDIPGPGPAKGAGYDWVRVEKLENNAAPDAEEENCGMQLRASAPPGKSTESAAHFFSTEATSTFVIRRNGNTVTVSYHGRNEIPNTGTEKKSDNLRNTLVAMGAFAGLSEIQWSALIKAFLEEEIGG